MQQGSVRGFAGVCERGVSGVVVKRTRGGVPVQTQAVAREQHSAVGAEELEHVFCGVVEGPEQQAGSVLGEEQQVSTGGVVELQHCGSSALPPSSQQQAFWSWPWLWSWSWWLCSWS